MNSPQSKPKVWQICFRHIKQPGKTCRVVTVEFLRYYGGAEVGGISDQRNIVPVKDYAPRRRNAYDSQPICFRHPSHFAALKYLELPERQDENNEAQDNEICA